MPFRPAQRGRETFIAFAPPEHQPGGFLPPGFETAQIGIQENDKTPSDLLLEKSFESIPNQRPWGCPKKPEPCRRTEAFTIRAADLSCRLPALQSFSNTSLVIFTRAYYVLASTFYHGTAG